MLTGRDVTDDGKFRGQLNIRKEKLPELFGEGSSPEPCEYWIENKLVATICISRRD
jgi:hypothetical protein